MEYLIIGMLSILSLLITIRPLTHLPKELDRTDPNKNLFNARSEIYQEMELLRLDYELGLLETGQYQKQIHQYRIQLASILIAEGNT